MTCRLCTQNMNCDNFKTKKRKELTRRTKRKTEAIDNNILLQNRCVHNVCDTYTHLEHKLHKNQTKTK